MGGLEIVGIGAIAVQLQATKSATFRCRFNDGEYVTCKQHTDILIYSRTRTLIYCKGVNGQVFRNLTSGTYTLFIEATAIDNTKEVAYDTVGPVIFLYGIETTSISARGK